MSDEARIERLAELARRVWPTVTRTVSFETRILVEQNGTLVRAEQGAAWRIQIHDDGGRALDALEAALLSLAGEPRVNASHVQNASEHVDRIRRLRAELDESWVDQLASQWERDATMAAHCEDQGDAFLQCARELRERAKP